MSPISSLLLCTTSLQACSCDPPPLLFAVAISFKECVEVYQLVKIKKGSLSNESRRFRDTGVGKIMESGGRVERPSTG